MTALQGKAKAAFLARMAAGRKAAAALRKVSRRKGQNPRVSRTSRSPRGGRPGRRKNPELLVINPASSRSRSRRGSASQSRLLKQKAVDAYKRFHGIAPKKCTKLGSGTGVLIALGELREIVYQPRRGHRKGPAFFHHFKPGNVLATTPDGKKLVIVDRKSRKAVDFDLGIVN